MPLLRKSNDYFKSNANAHSTIIDKKTIIGKKNSPMTTLAELNRLTGLTAHSCNSCYYKRP